MFAFSKNPLGKVTFTLCYKMKCVKSCKGCKERLTSTWQERLTPTCRNLLRRSPLVWTCALCIAAFPCMSGSCRHLSDETSAFLTDHHNQLGLGDPTSTGLRWATGPLHTGGYQDTLEEETECVRSKGEDTLGGLLIEGL